MLPSGECPEDLYFDNKGSASGSEPGCGAFVCAIFVITLMLMIVNKVDKQSRDIKHMQHQEIRSADDTVSYTVDKIYYLEQKQLQKQDSLNNNANVMAPDGTKVNMRIEYIKNKLLDALRSYGRKQKV